MSDTPKTREQLLASLRKPFPASVVGKLPKPINKDAKKGQCQECGKYHGLPAVHLDYVGHAAVTDRLLGVDPGWTWEPLALTESGLPAYDNAGGLWIKLTILGVTRLGYGDGDTPKERIGDAIRNAAMRFGVALDLWSKEELPLDGLETALHPDDLHKPEGQAEQSAPAPATKPVEPTSAQLRESKQRFDEARAALPQGETLCSQVDAEAIRVAFTRAEQATTRKQAFDEIERVCGRRIEKASLVPSHKVGPVIAALEELAGVSEPAGEGA